MCHCVMYRQVTAWLLHGMLLDKHGEFFVHKSAVASLAERQYDEDDLGIGGVTGRQMREVMVRILGQLVLLLLVVPSSSSPCTTQFRM